MATIKSIEEKAKAYDEAIARANEMIKAMTNIGGVAKVDDIQYIFPELKESEDEKMREMAIKAVYAPEAQSCIKSWGINPDDVIAWLEKQGEQNPYGKRQECVDCQFNYAGECKGSCAMKRDEQKPTWSNVDDEIPYPETLEKAIDLYYYSYGNGEGEFEHLSLERFRDIVHTFVNDYGQKPAWSEEDEEIRKGLIKGLEDRMGFGWASDPFSREEYIDWLKSLRHQNRWKPSEGQLECLGYAIEKAEKNWSPLTNNRIYLTLKALKEQLEKL